MKSFSEERSSVCIPLDENVLAKAPAKRSNIFIQHRVGRTCLIVQPLLSFFTNMVFHGCLT